MYNGLKQGKNKTKIKKRQPTQAETQEGSN